MNLKTRQAIHILRGIDPDLADHVKSLHDALTGVTHPAWKFSNWNDHNFTEEHRSRWRRETQVACMAAEPYIEPRLEWHTDAATILARIEDAGKFLPLEDSERDEWNRTINRMKEIVHV